MAVYYGMYRNILKNLLSVVITCVFVAGSVHSVSVMWPVYIAHAGKLGHSSWAVHMTITNRHASYNGQYNILWRYIYIYIYKQLLNTKKYQEL